MHKRVMNTQGLTFSPFVQGYWRLNDWQLSSAELLAFIEQHLALGISTVDHAHVYGNPDCESEFGKALALQPSLRQSLEIVSKCGITPVQQRGKVSHYDSSKASIIASAELSLRRLQTDYLDTLLLHRPDYLMAADEVAEAFNELQQSGKVRSFGVSNFTPSQVSLLQSRLAEPLITNQIEISPLHLQALDDGVLDQCQQLAMPPMAWSCLGGGRLFDVSDAQAHTVAGVLSDLQRELNAPSIETVAFAWILRLPCKPIPVIGSGNLERIAQYMTALQLNLSQEQWYRVWVASKGHDVP